MKKLKYFIVVCSFCLFIQNLQAQTTKPTKLIPAAEYYVGGQDSMYSFINKNAHYPMMAKRNRIQGECIVKFVIGADGKASGYQLVKNVGGGLGEEAARIVTLLKFKAPGYKLQTSIPIIFKL